MSEVLDHRAFKGILSEGLKDMGATLADVTFHHDATEYESYCTVEIIKPCKTHFFIRQIEDAAALCSRQSAEWFLIQYAKEQAHG